MSASPAGRAWRSGRPGPVPASAKPPVTGGPCWTEPGTGDLAGAERLHTGLFGRRPEGGPRQEAGGRTVARLGEAAAVEEAGRTVVLGPMEVFDAGRFAVALDPAGADFQLWQGRAFPGAGLFDAPGRAGPGGADDP